MSNGYGTSGNQVVAGATISIGASETNTVVSNAQRLSASDSKNLVVRVRANNTTVAAGITAKLQQRWSEDEDWALVGSQAQVVIPNGLNGWVSFALNMENATDEAQLPLAPLVRLVVTSGAGDATDIEQVIFSQRR